MPDTLLVVLFFVVALFYSSIGFGGGSSYLAILSLFLTDFNLIRATALSCNVAVVAGSVFIYLRQGLFDWRRFVPFVVLSMPAAFAGAQFRFSQEMFFILLGLALVAAASILLIKMFLKMPVEKKEYANGTTLGLGIGVGLLSGLVGIGGGIFLSPVLNLMQWDNPKKIAALASFFILVNSLAGLAGLLISNSLAFDSPLIFFLLGAVIAGGQIGSRLSVKLLRPQVIKLLTACLVLYVGLRLLLLHTLGINI
jgi:uncharacterized membrane protein YfcA